MTTIKFSKLPQFRVLIQADDLILNQIYIYTTLQETVVEYNWKTRRNEFKTAETHYTKKGYNGLICTQNLAKLIIDHIEQGQLMIPNHEIILDDDLKDRFGYNPSKRIKIIDKWIEIFNGHPKGKSRAEMQIEDSEVITSNNYGIVSLFTGYGKTEIILSIAESYLSEFEDNLAIIIFNNKVKEEIILRAKKYGIEISSKFDIKSRINIINPVGFFRSKASKEPESIEWLNNVDCVLADEAHHYSAESWSKLIQITDPYFSYGFTATADVKGGQEFISSSLKINKCTTQVISTFQNTGYFLVNRTLPVPVRILRTQIEITTKEHSDAIFIRNPTYTIKMVNDLIQDVRFAQVIGKIYNQYLNNGICFIPITTVDSGMDLARNLNKIGVKTVFWSADKSGVPDNEGNLVEANESFSLEALKELSKLKAFDILVTTVVGTEGIDLANLNSVIPITGNSFKMIIQPLGRAARSEEVTAVFIWDKNNVILNKQMTSKYKMIKSTLNVVHNETIYVN